MCGFRHAAAINPLRALSFSDAPAPRIPSCEACAYAPYGVASSDQTSLAVSCGGVSSELLSAAFGRCALISLDMDDLNVSTLKR